MVKCLQVKVVKGLCRITKVPVWFLRIKLAMSLTNVQHYLQTFIRQILYLQYFLLQRENVSTTNSNSSWNCYCVSELTPCLSVHRTPILTPDVGANDVQESGSNRVLPISTLQNLFVKCPLLRVTILPGIVARDAARSFDVNSTKRWLFSDWYNAAPWPMVLSEGALFWEENLVVEENRVQDCRLVLVFGNVRFEHCYKGNL